MLFVAGHAAAASESAAKVVYQWNPLAFHPAETNPWKAELVKRPDAPDTVSIISTGLGFNNYLFVSKDRFASGRDYTAIIRYEIVAPPKFPDSFYLFARSSKLGQARDVWQYWTGDPGNKGVAKLRLSIKGNQQTDDWAIYGGCKGPGSIIINSFEVVEGNGLDYIPATPAGESATKTDTVDHLPTGAQAFTIEAPAPKKGIQLSAKDFGLTADGPDGPVSTEIAAANFEAMVAMLKACKSQDASALIFPKGVYRFHSNAAIPIVDLADVTIDGQGSEFIFEKLHTGVEAISVQRCQRMVIRNLKFDWDWNVMPIASLARVMAVSEDGKSYDMSFPDLNEKEISLVKTAPWTHLIPMDPVTLTRGADRYPISIASIENIDATTLRVTAKTPLPLKVGEFYCARHLYYNFEAFKVGFSNHLVFDDVTIYSVPGMGWLNAGDMHHWKLSNCKIIRREGSRHPLTTAADGFHVSQSQGNLAIENCEFTGSGDDSINIHDNCFQGVERVDDSTLSLINCPPYRLRFQVGDTLELFQGDYSTLGYVSTVKAAVYKNQTTTLTLSSPLPAGLSPFSIALNRRYDTRNVWIAGCHFHDTNGRSILLSARDSTIENCTFKNTVGTAIQFHTEIVGALWSEGSGASNVIVRGNTFENTSFEGRYENAVMYAGAKLPVGITPYPLFHDLLIEKNHFINSSGPAISLISAGKVTVRDNVIESRKATPEANGLAGSLYVAYSKDVLFSRNRWQSTPEIGKAGIVIDPSTTSAITAQENSISK